MHHKKLNYRPDIDGLRAVAVLAVIANHLPQKFLPSGFLGVDVFFVISGFVVSASLFGGAEGHRFSNFYANFLSRRVKRLLPALLVCVAITSVFVLLVDALPLISMLTGISALFGVANITLFSLGMDYFAPSSTLNAFTHTWSLGVEEQFYVVFPLLVWLTGLGESNRALRNFAKTVALISAVSVVLFVWLYGVNVGAAYFLMPTRMWELGVGALVYVYSTELMSPRFCRITGFASTGALPALLLSFLAPQQFAAWVTQVAVGLTAILLANSTRTISSHLLSRAPVVYLGKISYSLYLWHWPIVALAPMALDVPWQLSSLYVVAMLGAAVCSYHLVERPLRKADWTRSKVRDIGLGFSCSFVLAGAAVLGLVNHGRISDSETKALYPDNFLPTLNSGLAFETCVVNEYQPFTLQKFDECTTPPKAGMPVIWAMGDSHVGHLQGMLYELHTMLGVGVHFMVTPGITFPASSGDEYPPNEAIFNEILMRLKPGDIVLLSRLLLSRDNPHVPSEDLAPWIRRVSSLAKELKERGVAVVVTGPPPMFNFRDTRECKIARREYCSIERSTIAPQIEQVTKQLIALPKENSNVLVFDMFAQLCPRDSRLCYPDDGIRFLFRDKDHLNSLGSQRLAKPFANFLHSAGALPE